MPDAGSPFPARGGGYRGRVIPPPWCIVVAGVSGAGKSTIAGLLADATGAEEADGDDFHTPAARAKMASGTPLDDADRTPWLAAVRSWTTARHDAGENSVVSCSALRRRYRDELSLDRAWVRFCLLDVPVATLRDRLAGRSGHFMPASLLPSQLETLEPLAPDEAGVTITAVAAPDRVARAALRALGLHDVR